MRPAARLRSSSHGQILAKLDLDVALGHQLRHGTNSSKAAELLLADCPEPEAGLSKLAQLFSEGVEAALGWSFSLLELDSSHRSRMGSSSSPSADLELAVKAVPALDQARSAGVAGGEAALSQLLISRGAARGFDGTSPEAASGSFLTGLSDEEYFAAAPAALFTLAAKKLVTPVAGALTKSLVELAYDTVIGSEDCGSEAPVRSPLRCLGPNPCRRCYGHDPAAGESPPVGSHVGILAAMFVGEASTQKAMKTFQGGGTGDDVAETLPILRAAFGTGSPPGRNPWVRLGIPVRSQGIAGTPDRKGWPEAEDSARSPGGRKALRELPGGRSRLEDVFGQLDGPEQCLPLAQIIRETLDFDNKATVHIELILRALWTAWCSNRDSGGSLAARAETVGDPVVDATNRGNLRLIVEALGDLAAGAKRTRRSDKQRLISGLLPAHAVGASPL